MYATIHHYTLNPIFEHDFTVRWTSLVETLRQKSILQEAVLHRENSMSFISYTKFANRETYLQARSLLAGAEAVQWQRIMDCCNSITELHRMDVIQKLQQTN